MAVDQEYRDLTFKTWLEAFRVVPNSLMRSDVLDKMYKLLANNRDVAFYFVPHPNGWEAGVGRIQFYNYYAVPSSQTIHINVPMAQQSPYTTGLLQALRPIFGKFSVEINHENVGTVEELIGKMKDVVGMYNPFSHYQQQRPKRFGIRVLKEIWETNWYHATLKKYIGSIKRQGLQPSKPVDDYADETGAVNLGNVEKRGWSDFNMDLQRVVYLTSNINDAKEIARTLTNQHGITAVVLKIDGSALVDYTKLVIDEDALRNDSRPDRKNLNKFMPPFLQSAIQMQTIGYKGTIPSQYIKVVEEIASDGEWLEGDETLNLKVAMPPSECPCKKKKPKDTVGYPVPAQQTNQLYAVPTKVAGGY